MEPNVILLIILILLLASYLSYQIFKMTELDATSRGFKHPKLWGMFTNSGQNRGGLVFYLIGRRKYISTMSEEDKKIIESRKKKIYVSFTTLVILSILCIAFIIFK